jgi:hypothetical protein
MQSSTGQTRAEIAADAFGFIDHELALAVDAGEDRLMRGVLAYAASQGDHTVTAGSFFCV